MNRATRIIVVAIGVILGIAGMDHGFFETLQGNTPTNGLIIQAIGDTQQMWLYGNEEAFTIKSTPVICLSARRDDQRAACTLG